MKRSVERSQRKVSLAAGVCFLTLAASAQLPPSIEGRAVNLVTGEPVRRAILTLRPAGQQGSPRSATSDSAGRFLFESVPPGTYRLSAERTGFLRQDYGGRPSSSTGAPLSISAGQPITGLIFKLTPQGVISGRVLDEEG